ncbi:unnamed protein product [Darwinula stevensoni]|uniref:Probable oligoribonuclease n=1 Tax=Darwinula stevensoni TaxID=69355 RepID=A0A7R8ZZ86_9CRUS|nr:unnamed protein product [Darwinula stevensoni]CAG0882052.1 unnamed protein product [Darwinula stevensoni]
MLRILSSRLPTRNILKIGRKASRAFFTHQNSQGLSQMSTQNLSSLSSVADSAKQLVWLDLELTGLEVESDHILEAACIVTDGDLNVVAECPLQVINWPDDILNNMAEWPKEHHLKTGLTQACRESKTSLEDAERILLEFLKKHVPKGKCPLAGNSVYMDRIFLMREMPLVHNYLHYRILDVSTIKELARRWYPQVIKSLPQKQFTHRAYQDILESIQELQAYRKTIFRSE